MREEERMFKKVVEAESPQRLSGPDRKKLRRSIKEKFQRASNSDLDALLPQLAVMPMLYYSFIFLLYCIVNNSILQAKITVVKLQNRVSDVLQCSCPRLRDFRNSWEYRKEQWQSVESWITWKGSKNNSLHSRLAFKLWTIA